MAYFGYITTLKEIRKHTNADRLQVATVFGNDVVIGLDMKVGDKVLYLPTDGQLDYDFAKDNNLLRLKDEHGNSYGGYMDESKRNIKSIRLRGEKSDGIIMKIDVLSPYTDVNELKDGDKIDTLNGVLLFQKYIPKSKSKIDTTIKTKKEKKKILFPFFEQHIDTSQLAYNLRSFKEGDLCYITLKMHGTSGRTGHLHKKETNWLRKLLHMKKKKTWDFVTGTRRVVLDSFNQEGYYGDNNFRKQWHDVLSEKLPKGMTAYYEIVGYTDSGALIMPEVSNKKVQDKAFVKQYGETTQFTYGCGYGQSEMYIYRITYTNEDGEVLEIPWEQVKTFCELNGLNHVPEFDKFIFTTEEDLIERVKKYEDGTDPIGKTHIKEGVVVRVENKNPKFQAYKQKCFEFKYIEGLIKDDGILDMEESESIKESDVIG